MAHGFVIVSNFTLEGARMIFGEQLTDASKLGFIFAFQVLPTVIFFAALMGVLYHLGVMQAVVRAMAWGITKVMRVSGAETTSVCASVFIGQTEAPILIAPYIASMTTSELLTMMTGGMAHVSGAVMLAYVTMGAPLKYLITASVMDDDTHSPSPKVSDAQRRTSSGWAPSRSAAACAAVRRSRSQSCSGALIAPPPSARGPVPA